MDVKTPYFLVALPQLNDSIFSKSVILMVAHEPSGSFGFIVNKVLRDEEDSLARMVAEVKDAGGNTLLQYEETVFEGGPVNEESLVAIHGVEKLGSSDSQIGDYLFLENNAETFQLLLEDEKYKNKRRFLLGSSQWEAGQLESEIRSGSWVILPYNSEKLFGDQPTKEESSNWQEEIWKSVLKDAGIDPLILVASASDDSGYN